MKCLDEETDDHLSPEDPDQRCEFFQEAANDGSHHTAADRREDEKGDGVFLVILRWPSALHCTTNGARRSRQSLPATTCPQRHLTFCKTTVSAEIEAELNGDIHGSTCSRKTAKKTTND